MWLLRGIISVGSDRFPISDNQKIRFLSVCNYAAGVFLFAIFSQKYEENGLVGISVRYSLAPVFIFRY